MPYKFVDDISTKPMQSKFRLVEENEPQQTNESILGNIGRQALRTGSRIAETALSAPRETGEFFESLIPEQALIKGAEKIGLGQGAKNLLETTKKIAPYKIFPKREQVQDLTSTLFGEKAKPQNEWEQKADDLITDFTSLALPFPGQKLKTLKPALLALGGNVASEIIGKMGGSEKEKTAAKLGTFVLGSFINPKSAENLKNDLYSKARDALPQNATVSSTTLENSLNQLEKSLKKGGIAGSDKEALQKIADIKNEMQGAQIPVDALERLKVKINESKAGIYKQLEGNKPGIKSAKRNLDMVGKTVDDALKLYGQHNPEWEAFYRPANEVHGAIAESHKARNFIGRIANKYGKHAVLPLLGIGHVAGPGATIGGALATGAVGTPLLLGGEIASKVWKSKTLRKLYFDLIQSALKENVLSTKTNLDKLEEKLQSSE